MHALACIYCTSNLAYQLLVGTATWAESHSLKISLQTSGYSLTTASIATARLATPTLLLTAIPAGQAPGNPPPPADSQGRTRGPGRARARARGTAPPRGGP